MTAALRIPSGNADCWTFPADYREAVLVCSSVCLESLDACAHFDGFASVVGAFVVDDLDAFEVMGPDAYGACAGRFADVTSYTSVIAGWS